jgi:hypothetical protein
MKSRWKQFYEHYYGSDPFLLSVPAILALTLCLIVLAGVLHS